MTIGVQLGSPPIVLRPWSLRVPALVGIVVAHGLVLTYAGGKVEPPFLPSVPIELVDLPLAPETTMPEQALPEATKPEEVQEKFEPPPVLEEPPPPEPSPMEKQPEPEPLPPPVIEELPSPPPPVPKPEPVKPPLPRPKPKPTAIDRKRVEPIKRVQSAPPSTRLAAVNGPPAAPARSGPSAAEYGALVSAALRRNLTYPSGASGAGAVGVTLTIGPSGRAISAVVTSSSGNSAFDAAVRQAALAIQVPLPPNGRFTARTTIRFRQP